MGRSWGAWLGLVVTLALAAPASAQVRSPLEVWNRFYAGCATGPGQEYLCACAATELIRRCQQTGVTDAPALAQCIVTNERTWNADVTRLCTGYGHLQLGHNVRRPPARPITERGPPVSRDVLWSSTFGSCRGASPQDAMREFGCACIATYSVEACAPAPDTPAPHVQACSETLAPDVERAFPQCRQFAALTTPTSNSPGATAPTATPTPSGGSTMCADVEGLSSPRQRAACATIVAAIESDDPRGFLATIPRGGRVTLYDRANQSSAAVGRELRRHGVREMFGPRVRAIVAGEDGDPRLVLFSAERDDAAADWVPEAGFRWDAQRDRWTLIAIQANSP